MLPFTLRAIEDEQVARVGVSEARRHELLDEYPVLKEANNVAWKIAFHRISTRFRPSLMLFIMVLKEFDHLGLVSASFGRVKEYVSQFKFTLPGPLLGSRGSDHALEVVASWWHQEDHGPSPGLAARTGGDASPLKLPQAGAL